MAAKAAALGLVLADLSAEDEQSAAYIDLSSPERPAVGIGSETGAGEFAVLVVERQASADVARRRRVELGAVSGNAIAVKKGVALGERVVVSGATLLADGEAVRVLP